MKRTFYRKDAQGSILFVVLVLLLVGSVLVITRSGSLIDSGKITYNRQNKTLANVNVEAVSKMIMNDNVLINSLVTRLRGGPDGASIEDYGVTLPGIEGEVDISATYRSLNGWSLDEVGVIEIEINSISAHEDTISNLNTKFSRVVLSK